MTGWKHGDKSRLAAACGISVQHLVDVLKRRKTMAPLLAHLCAIEAAKLGYDLSAHELMWSKHTRADHPLFG